MTTVSSKFQKLTEAPGDKASAEQVERLYHRYYLASQHAEDRRVLEVACGAGIGLSYLCAIAESVDGCDIDAANLGRSKELCRGAANVSVAWGDAQELPYPDASFDLVLLYEAIYYLPDAAKFVAEAHRVLKPDGELIICTVNPQWHSFHSSPLSINYYSASELKDLLSPLFPTLKIMGAFPVDSGGAKGQVLDVVKRFAMALHLIPRTLEGRARLKRIFFGKLQELPSRLEPGAITWQEPVTLDPAVAHPGFKIIYAVAGKKEKVQQEPLSNPKADDEKADDENITCRTDKKSGDHLKRYLDTFLSGTGILVFAPLLLIVGLSVYLHDFGPVLYRPYRVGKKKQLFHINKFRTMVPNADTIGGPTTSRTDNRITPIGRVLRRYKIDELPQLFNVLIGDMSLVGPRPEIASEVESYGPEWDPIFSVRPGMTDRSSIVFRNEDEIVASSGMRDAHEAYRLLIQPRKLQLQKEYALNHSLNEDIKIIRDTLTVVIKE